MSTATPALVRLTLTEQPSPALHVYAQPGDPAVLAAQQAYAAEWRSSRVG